MTIKGANLIIQRSKAMALLSNAAIFIVSFFLLVKSGSWSVRAVSRISAFLQISQFVVAFVLVGIITSLPELFVSISAAIKDDSVLAFGNVVGSNIIYPTLLIGLASMAARRIRITRDDFNKNNIYAFLIALLPFLLMIGDLELSRFDGLILVTVFIWYFMSLIEKKKAFSRIYENVFNGGKGIKIFFKELFILVGSLFLLIVSSELIVRTSVNLTQQLNLSLFMVGIFLVAIGVALPELIFSIKSIMVNSEQMMMGNLFGSLVVNSGLALGIAAIISPVVIANVTLFWTSAFFAVASLGLFGILARTRSVITWREGLILIFFYIIFVATGFWLT